MTNKEYNTPKLTLWLPIILSFVLAAGIFIGKSLNNYHSNTQYILQDPNKLDLVIQRIDKEYVDTIDKNKMIEDAVTTILSNFDPHTTYIAAKDLEKMNEHLQGNFDGIGVQFNILKDTVLVINTISGGPAEKVGVMAGDKIVTVNDSVFAGNGITNDKVIKQLKGKRGTSVKVGVKRKGYPEILNFEIVRDKIPVNTVDVAYMLDKEIGYIKISAFGATTHQEFAEAIRNLKAEGMTKMILDLRQNGGGYLGAAVNIADELLSDKKLIVYTQGKARNRKDYKATANGLFEEGALAVLIDSWSASASEVVSGAIQDNDRGSIVGRRSFGKGLVQETTRFRDGSAMQLTTARYYTPSGRCIQKPYNKGNEKYQMDIYERYANGEMTSADSIHFDNNKQFKTSKGNIVYDGGGITPDIFVPIDTMLQTPVLNKLSSKIYKYSLEYTNKHRENLSKLKTHTEIINFLNNHNMFDNFLQIAKKEGITFSKSEIKENKEILKTYLHAYICRNILDDKGFYAVMQDIDTTLLKAIEHLKK